MARRAIQVIPGELVLIDKDKFNAQYEATQRTASKKIASESAPLQDTTEPAIPSGFAGFNADAVAQLMQMHTASTATRSTPKKPRNPRTPKPPAPAEQASVQPRIDIQPQTIPIRLQQMADSATAAAAIYREYQANRLASERLRTEIIKGANEGADGATLLLLAMEAISRMTGDSVFLEIAQKGFKWQQEPRKTQSDTNTQQVAQNPSDGRTGAYKGMYRAAFDFTMRYYQRCREADEGFWQDIANEMSNIAAAFDNDKFVVDMLIAGADEVKRQASKD